jgi:hypothetical protein
LKKKRKEKNTILINSFFLCEEGYKKSPPLLVFVNIRLVTRATPLADPIFLMYIMDALVAIVFLKKQEKP